MERGWEKASEIMDRMEAACMCEIEGAAPWRGLLVSE